MKKVLVIDDNIVNRKLLKKILCNEFDVILAKSGEEALAILDSQSDDFACILLDLLMPKMNGYQVMEIIKSSLRLRNIPIVVQTMQTDNETESKCLKLGASDFVTKPYNPDAITTRIKNLIATNEIIRHAKNIGKDDITGLVSIDIFHEEAKDRVKSNPSKSYDVIAMDIRNFRLINDSFGVEMGNNILRSIGLEINKKMEIEDFLCSRVYGDRFVFLKERKANLITDILTSASKITTLYSDRMNVLFKFGIYEIADNMDYCFEMCSKAFSALTVLRDNYHTQYHYYDDDLHENILFEEKANNEMNQALENGEFEIYIQPKYDLHTNSIAGGEALVRWNHPKDGLIPPCKFISIFEKNGFISQLDCYVWQKSARLLHKWIKNKMKIVPISVNISRKDIEYIEVADYLINLVKKYDLPPELLRLEITETAYMEDEDKIIEVVKRLKNHGFIIEMDDFGSGYSSLSMLAKLPIDILKLDMNFIQGITNSLNSKTIVEYTIYLAKWINVPIIAEGVETYEQLDFLRKFDCDYIQGFIFSKPIMITEFEKLLISYPLLKEKKETKSTSNKLKMHIIEDMEMNQAIIENCFNDNFEVSASSNGIEALDYLQLHHQEIDIIILDIYMPEMDGFVFLEQFYKQHFFNKIPILVISSIATNSDIAKIYELGADEFLSKPFSSEAVIEKVYALLHMYNKVDDISISEFKQYINNPITRKLYNKVFIFDNNVYDELTICGNELVKTNKNILDYSEYLPVDKIKNNQKDIGLFVNENRVTECELVKIDNKKRIIVMIKEKI